MLWTPTFPHVSAAATARLSGLVPQVFAKGQVLFHPGDVPTGFVILLSGRIEVHLTGPNGREILLYSVEPGQSCIQTTMGLLAEDIYSGQAVAATDVRAVMIPKTLFLSLMNEEEGFRRYVLQAFASRMQDITRLLERVAFGRVENRLAEELLALSEQNEVHATQQDLATRIGSAREVVTRNLDRFQKAGWVTTERGAVHILDRRALEIIATSVT